MVTITLPPELERVVSERARRQGATPEVYLLGELRERYLPETPAPSDGLEGETMADFFEGYAGTVNSRELLPDGAHLSTDTGRRFSKIMIEKRQKGHL